MSQALQLPSPTWFIGCGNMGGAILDGWRLGGIDLGAVTVIRPSGTPIEGTRTVTSVAEAGAPPRLAVLAFKPQKLDDIAPDLRRHLSASTIVVSLLAGVEAASLRQRFPGVGAVVRAIPNLPVAVRRGVTGLFTADADPASKAELNNLFAALGFAMWMADEDKLAALGAVAGAGPAYVARFVDALAKAGERRGLTSDIAAILARETVLGTAWMASTANEDMASVARRVASPNGTTEAGLKVLDGDDHVLNRLIQVAIDAAAARGAELAAEAKAASLEGNPSLS
jgi:pyrroline-5-carboxylate reductase